MWEMPVPVTASWRDVGMEWRWPKRQAVYAVSTELGEWGYPNPLELIKFHTNAISRARILVLTLVQSFLVLPQSFYLEGHTYSMPLHAENI